MKPYYLQNDVKLYQGDCLELLSLFKAESIDAIVTDPPAGISFMNEAWDKDKGGRNNWINWFTEIMKKCLVCLKPGAHALVWSIPRTSHWTATALENAGFEIRDVLVHIFGTGFPKSLNLGGGIGTALKPAHENWILARKPVEGTVLKNKQKYKTGGLNIDATRVEVLDKDAKKYRGEWNRKQSTRAKNNQVYHTGLGDIDLFSYVKSGRWPSNLLLSHTINCRYIGTKAEKGYVINRWSDGSKPFGGGAGHPYKSVKQGEQIIENWKCAKNCPINEINKQRSGSAMYFHNFVPDQLFRYCVKPNRKERDLGCENLTNKTGAETVNRKENSVGLNSPRAGAGRKSGGKNFHPTVKSIELMKWLICLITPSKGIILDPFMGSGSTGIAACQEGFSFIGIELDLEYCEIAKARIGTSISIQRYLFEKKKD